MFKINSKINIQQLNDINRITTSASFLYKLRNFAAKTKLYFLTLLAFLLFSFCSEPPIHEHGYWIGEDVGHYYDVSLSKEMISFLQKEGAKSVVDFGCGSGQYVKALLENHIDTEGYDGNPDTCKLTNGLGKVIDLLFSDN